MEKEMYMLYSKIYNELVKSFVSSGLMEEPDRYEREDAFMSEIIEIENGKDAYEEFKSSFNLVHDVDLSEQMFKSAYDLNKDFNGGK